MFNYRIILFAISVFALAVLHTVADAFSEEKNVKPDSKATKLSMVTGLATGTYFRIGKDIQDSLAKDNINIDVHSSNGSIDNINRIGSTESASLGIVQSDVMGFLVKSEQPESRKLAERLRLVFPLFQEEVHLLGRSNITRLSDIAGKTVVFGAKGSGTWLTAINILKITGIRPARILRLAPEEGVVAILQGKADAMFAVGGKPMKVFQNLADLKKNKEYQDVLKQIHFIPIDDPVLFTEYMPAVLEPSNYNLLSAPLATIAVTAILTSYDFSEAQTPYATKRCEDIRNFSKTLAGKLDWLKQNGHQKWKEVNMDTELGLWKKDECIAQGTDFESYRIENELLKDLQHK
jgi:uncharacterized protein